MVFGVLVAMCQAFCYDHMSVGIMNQTLVQYVLWTASNSEVEGVAEGAGL